jgi:hypothetical protein
LAGFIPNQYIHFSSAILRSDYITGIAAQKLKIMKLLYCLFSLLFLVTVFFISCGSKQSNATKATALSKDSLIRNGAHLVAIMGCEDCHSPKTFGPHGPQTDSQRILSGYPSDRPLLLIDTANLKNWIVVPGFSAFAGPWGVSFAANITSDQTGIGN